MDWLQARNHRTQLILTAASASLLTAGAISAYNQYSRRKRRLELQNEVLEAVARQEDFTVRLPEPGLVPSETRQLVQERVVPVHERLTVQNEAPEDLFREQLARVYAVFKDEGMVRIRNAKVVVVGCGGVGSWAAVMLVRSCVESRTLHPIIRTSCSLQNIAVSLTFAWSILTA